MEKKDIKWASIIPLIGGMMLGAKKTLGTDPEYILSYDAFASNDSHARLNFPETPYGTITDEGVSFDKPYTAALNGVDVVVSLCPCAGLSGLNTSKKEGSTMARGANAVQNDWMYKSSEYVLENVQPRVLWGENAPGLYTAMGKDVADRLHQIGKKHGYSFTVIKTSTSLHGIPQRRTRSFYFFWKGTTAPILEWIKKESPSLEEYLSQAPIGEYSNKSFMKEPLTDDPMWRWLRDVEGKTMKDAAAEGAKTMLLYVFSKEGRIESMLNYMRALDEKKAQGYVRLFERAQLKKVWDATPHINTGDMPAVVGRTLQLAVHPTEERWMSVQELMWMMGIDADYKLAHEGYQQISQNVPVPTAADWMGQVVTWLNGGLLDSGVDYMKQDNMAQRIDTIIPITTKTLF
jgi:site-specific DNA-cytosine methylase